MKTSLFDFQLPDHLVAQKPARPRDSSRLLVVSRETGESTDHTFSEILAILRPGDLLIRNESKVFKARLRAKTTGGKEVELFILEEERGGMGKIRGLAKPARLLSLKETITIHEAPFTIEEKHRDGSVTFQTPFTWQEMLVFANTHGEIPLPPYITNKDVALEEYQTSYATKEGSVAAPTAGLHFTHELTQTLKEKGIRIAHVTLHVGMGTFQPIKTEMIEEHEIHEEYIEISEDTARAIKETRAHGGRIIAVGTTSLRTIESMQGRAGSMRTKLYITPGFPFRIVDGLITNFHLPRSSLLVLVSAFLGYENTMRVYTKAIESGYRFYSFGDAMLII